jgi:hypothetical protein
MKNFLLFLMLIGLSPLLKSQNATIKTSPLALAFGSLNACYEKMLNEKSSFEISGNYVYKVFGVEVNSGGLGAGYRAYLTKKDGPRGLYIMPNAGFNIGSSGDFSYNTITGGLLLGYQIAAGSGFVFDAGAGPNYTILGGDYEEIGFDREGGVLPSIRLAIGYSLGGSKKINKK